MHPMKVQEYRSRYVATVRITDQHIEVAGGRAEKQRLRLAMRETDFCYVKDLASNAEVKLVLLDGQWVPEDLTTQ